MELANTGNLLSYIKKRGKPLSESEARWFFQ